MALRPQPLRKLLSTLLNQLIFGSPSNHWVPHDAAPTRLVVDFKRSKRGLGFISDGCVSSHQVLTRSGLSLMLIGEQGFVDYKDELIQSQTSADHHQRLQGAFATLLNNVHRNLECARGVGWFV